MRLVFIIGFVVLLMIRIEVTAFTSPYALSRGIPPKKVLSSSYASPADIFLGNQTVRNRKGKPISEVKDFLGERHEFHELPRIEFARTWAREVALTWPAILALTSLPSAGWSIPAFQAHSCRQDLPDVTERYERGCLLDAVIAPQFAVDGDRLTSGNLGFVLDCYAAVS